ncbi:unnamed protein product [Echinostoma caproni]|uniref:J domain-containing protein n=1 Tax=Echinostoma caproni TaxID=27848 RepID=A0A182ZZH4_9TREM|nr:unnamed protein product [Echinostoma caproni]
MGIVQTLLESIVEPDVCERFGCSRVGPMNGSSSVSSASRSNAVPDSHAGAQNRSQRYKRPSVPESGALPQQQTNRNSTENKPSNQYTPHQLQAVTRIRQARTHQERLGVSYQASLDEINRAYRKLAFTVHPDKNFAPGSEEAFKLLVAARTALMHQPDLPNSNYKFHAAF